MWKRLTRCWGSVSLPCLPSATSPWAGERGALLKSICKWLPRSPAGHHRPPSSHYGLPTESQAKEQPRALSLYHNLLLSRATRFPMHEFTSDTKRRYFCGIGGGMQLSILLFSVYPQALVQSVCLNWLVKMAGEWQSWFFQCLCMCKCNHT